MEKGKTKNTKEYLSILFVPSNLDNIREFKVSSFHIKLAAVFAVLLSVFISMAAYIGYLSYKNSDLNKSLEALNTSAVEQKSLLAEKADEIDKINQINDNFNNKLKEFTDKYKEMTDNYLKTSISSSLSGRSGDRSGLSFINDIKQLKSVLLNLKEVNKQDEVIIADLNEIGIKLNTYLDNAPTLFPASGSMGTGFGYRIDPFLKIRKFHEGVDIDAAYGSKIKASAAGKVITAGYAGGYGNCIVIDHGRGIKTIYGHASKLLAKAGQAVKKGDVIAKVGSTGRSTGPHLHFEVRIDDQPANPLKYLDY